MSEVFLLFSFYYLLLLTGLIYQLCSSLKKESKYKYNLEI